MVSVKICSLPTRYIDAAHKLIEALDNAGGGIEYAFFYLRYGENEEWYNGDWWLCIISDVLGYNTESIRIVNDAMKRLNINLPDFSYNIESPDVERDNYYYRLGERVDIKPSPEI